MAKSSERKKGQLLTCKICDYSTFRMSQYERHVSTAKHIDSVRRKQLETTGNEKVPLYTCSQCNKTYRDRSGLWKHSKKCPKPSHTRPENAAPNIVQLLLQDNSDLKQIILEQQSMLKQIIETNNQTQPTQTYVTNNITTNTNSTNKFNLNFFLHETCKNAMNITQFVNSIQVHLTDVIEMGTTGYAEGLSRIIVRNLNALDECERPLHCTDKKREILYIKNHNEWEREDEQRTRLRQAIDQIANKNISFLPRLRETYISNNSSGEIDEGYDKMVIELMGGKDDYKDKKIIKNITNAVIIKHKDCCHNDSKQLHLHNHPT